MLCCQRLFRDGGMSCHAIGHIMCHNEGVSCGVVMGFVMSQGCVVIEVCQMKICVNFRINKKYLFSV